MLPRCARCYAVNHPLPSQQQLTAASTPWAFFTTSLCCFFVSASCRVEGPMRAGMSGHQRVPLTPPPLCRTALPLFRVSRPLPQSVRVPQRQGNLVHLLLEVRCLCGGSGDAGLDVAQLGLRGGQLQDGTRGGEAGRGVSFQWALKPRLPLKSPLIATSKHDPKTGPRMHAFLPTTHIAFSQGELQHLQQLQPANMHVLHASQSCTIMQHK